jgi:hypothetical protein
LKSNRALRHVVSAGSEILFNRYQPSFIYDDIVVQKREDIACRDSHGVVNRSRFSSPQHPQNTDGRWKMTDRRLDNFIGAIARIVIGNDDFRQDPVKPGELSNAFYKPKKAFTPIFGGDNDCRPKRPTHCRVRIARDFRLRDVKHRVSCTV